MVSRYFYKIGPYIEHIGGNQLLKGTESGIIFLRSELPFVHCVLGI